MKKILVFSAIVISAVIIAAGYIHLPVNQLDGLAWNGLVCLLTVGAWMRNAKKDRFLLEFGIAALVLLSSLAGKMHESSFLCAFGFVYFTLIYISMIMDEQKQKPAMIGIAGTVHRKELCDHLL
jgi:hypothetical protein